MEHGKEVFLVALISVSIFLALMFSQRNFLNVPKNSILSEDKLWDKTQQWRQDHNLPAYQKDSLLCLIAKGRVDQLKTDYSHDGFTNTNFSKIRYYKIGENLAKGAGDEEQTLHAWVVSKEHLSNLEDDYTHSCIATGGDIAVQIFGKY